MRGRQFLAPGTESEEAERSLDLMLRAECIWADGDKLESQ